MSVIRVIRLRAYGDEIIERVLMDFDRDHVYITTQEEYEAAGREGREPRMVGFRREDVVPDDTPLGKPNEAQS